MYYFIILYVCDTFTFEVAKITVRYKKKSFNDKRDLDICSDYVFEMLLHCGQVFLCASSSLYIQRTALVSDYGGFCLNFLSYRRSWCPLRGAPFFPTCARCLLEFFKIM